jgi:hypothetical protein
MSLPWQKGLPRDGEISRIIRWASCHYRSLKVEEGSRGKGDQARQAQRRAVLLALTVDEVATTQGKWGGAWDLEKVMRRFSSRASSMGCLWPTETRVGIPTYRTLRKMHVVLRV